ncbi:hypothetical protein [Streptomyces sp. NBC_01264]|uniref:hypothetical protein n=1 Tax=Streptomyces sp. NBC_01264 TaxID=2903804 RepID=UPI00224FC5A0|nr:hypothetical protein [Streptomyces sp. NBC_01264]MCX4780069.1 hypothetical protein [Streptomyces sp. NBC_01264]
MIHKPVIVTMIRELDPVDGWAVNEDAGLATVACSCGINTGWIGKTDAARLWRDHTTPTEPITVPIKLEADDAIFREAIKRSVRGNGGA